MRDNYDQPDMSNELRNGLQYIVDEGFGSLDDESREEAIKILNELAGDRRLVGIISHVTELKEQIDRKLVVMKDEKGSKVYWAE